MISKELSLQSIFNKASEMLLHELREKNQKEEITFLLPTKYVSEEAAKLGLLFDHICNQRRNKKTIHRTFFASCHWEALSGAIKLMRHHHWLKNRYPSGILLVYDPSCELKSLFNPIDNEEIVESLVPGLEFESSFQNLKHLIQESENCIGFIFCWDGLIPLEEVDALFAICKTKNIWTAFDEALLEDWYIGRACHRFLSPPDVSIIGENATNREVPFAAFIMTAKIYAPWNSISQCLTHSSSYSGNTIAIAMVLTLFKKYGLSGPEKQITGSRKAKFKAYATYVNPSIAWIFYCTKLSPEVQRAKGSWITTDRGKILDGIAGSGCCLRGHNPSDLITDVLNAHNPNHNYWKDLSDSFRQVSDLPHVFPAVSGSSATDISVILSLLGNYPRKRMITFKHNYSGKSLISINLTRCEYFRKPFYPLYFDVVEIDPFQEGAYFELENELLSGKVALIWFEILQGQDLDMIPAQIIDLINTHQEAGGYFVGIDEILTGMFRTGDFLCSKGKILKPDVIALAKGLSDMVFPMGCVLVSDKLYQAAKQENPLLVERLGMFFVNQLGSHITLNGFTKALEMNLPKHVKKMGSLFKNLVKDVIRDSPLYKDVRGEGLLLYLKLNKDAFPVNLLQEEFIEFLMSCSYLDKGGVLFLNSRITPALSINKNEIEIFCEKIKITLKKTKPFFLFLFCLKKIVYIHSLCVFQKIREKVFK